MKLRVPAETFAIAFVAALVCACSQTLRDSLSAQEMESHALEAQQHYLIGVNDVLRIRVWKQPELSLEEVTVRPDGKISVPLLDDVVAVGLTPAELKGVLTERLEEYIVAPNVTVVVVQINSKQIYVIGEVNRVGPMRLMGGMRVVDALSTAGGFRAFADKRGIKVIRNLNGSGPIEFVFDYEDFVNGKNLEQNILLLPGDRVVVPEQGPFWR